MHSDLSHEATHNSKHPGFMYKKAICLGTSSKQVTASPDDLRYRRKFYLYFALASQFSKANSTHKYIFFKMPFPGLNDLKVLLLEKNNAVLACLLTLANARQRSPRPFASLIFQLNEM